MRARPHLIYTADHYELGSWLAKIPARRGKYFVGIDHFREAVRGLTDTEPTEDQIVDLLMQALERDHSFSTHIAAWRGGANLTQKEFWAQLFEAAAITIASAYAAACDAGEWPRENPR